MMFFYRNEILSLSIVALLSLACVFLLDAFHFLPRDRAADSLIVAQAGRLPAQASALRFTLIDLDDATYEAWGEPAVTPRAKLLDILHGLVEIGPVSPEVIIVDIDTAYGAADLIAPGSGLPIPADELLHAWLAGYAGRPAVLLVRSLSGSEPGSRDYPKPQSSDLDRHVEPEFLASRLPNEGVHWGLASFRRGGEGVIRHGWLWRTVCLEDEPLALPSLQLLTLLSLSENVRDVTGGIAQRLQAQQPDDCTHPGMPSSLGSHPLTLDLKNGRSVDLDIAEAPALQRINFSMPWQHETGVFQAADGHRITEAPGSILQNSVPPDRFLRLPAVDLFDDQGRARLDQISPDAFAGRIVVIGASHEQARDRHATPLGSMPGSMVIINAIQSLAAYGTLTPPSWPVRLAHAAVLLVLQAFLFHVFAPTFATILIAIGMTTATFLASIYWLETGVWLDTTVAALSFVILRTLLENMPSLLDWSGGLRKILHPRYR